MIRARRDPGPCPICGAAHTTCSTGSGPIAAVLVPQRDAAARASSDPLLEPVTTTVAGGDADDPAPLLGDGSDGHSFSTGTFRRRKPKPR